MSKLREAAEELSRAWRGASLSEMILAVHKMDDALAEPEPEYELWGTINGSPGGRWPVEQIEELVWPVGTALYVRRGKK